MLCPSSLSLLVLVHHFWLALMAIICHDDLIRKTFLSGVNLQRATFKKSFEVGLQVMVLEVSVNFRSLIQMLLNSNSDVVYPTWKW